MAKRSKRQGARRPRPPAEQPAPAPAPALPVAKVQAPAPRAPVFWFGFEVSAAKLAAARWLIFGLLALDAFLQIRHAPRYGAGGFNVAQLPGFGLLAPGRAGYELGQLVSAYLFVLAAFGVGTRVVVPIAAAIYACLYFGSQLDSYQHHYLVALVLAIACFVPWRRPPSATGADADADAPVRTWAVRLLLVQLALMYLWAAISKLDPAWLDGRTLATQLSGNMRDLATRTIGFQGAAIAVVVVELALAATIWSRRGWIVAAPLGILFHLGIVLTGFEIGLFAYLMLALYALVLPDRVWTALADGPLRGARHALARAAAWPSWAMTVLALALGTVLCLLVRLEAPLLAGALGALVVIGLAVAAGLRGGRPPALLALAHVCAIGLWVVADRATTVAIDYYRFWGGWERRIGDLAAAEHAYRRVHELAPGDGTGPFQLGRILLERDPPDDDAGLALLHEAQRLEPARARAWAAEARWLAAKGRRAEAIAKAKEAVAAEPSHARARAARPAARRPRARRAARRRPRRRSAVVAAPAPKDRRGRAARIAEILDRYVPAPAIPLDHGDPFQLLVAVILSAQCTDARVNLVTPALFARAPTAAAMAKLTAAQIQPIIQTCGLAPGKARNLAAMSRLLVAEHGGEVPRDLDALERLPGVGHKTASVVMAQAFGEPAFPVDTHIHRLAGRWQLSRARTVEEVERDLKQLFPRERWSTLHLQIIYFGRSYCPARGHVPAACPICSWAMSRARAEREAKQQLSKPVIGGKPNKKPRPRR